MVAPHKHVKCDPREQSFSEMIVGILRKQGIVISPWPTLTVPFADLCRGSTIHEWFAVFENYSGYPKEEGLRVVYVNCVLSLLEEKLQVTHG